MKKLLIIITVIFLAGCGGESSDSEQQEPVRQVANRPVKVFPLEVGTRWIYDVKGYDTTVNALRAFKVDTFHVASDTIFEGIKWYEIDGLGGEWAYASNWDDGLYYSRPGGKPFMFIKYPVDVGDTFSSKIGLITAFTTVAATGLEVVVPAGTFLCHKYMQTVGPRKVTTNYYIAPGVGLIKMEILDRTGKYTVAENVLTEIKRE